MPSRKCFAGLRAFGRRWGSSGLAFLFVCSWSFNYTRTHVTETGSSTFQIGYNPIWVPEQKTDKHLRIAAQQDSTYSTKGFDGGFTGGGFDGFTGGGFDGGFSGGSFKPDFFSDWGGSP